jgi:hypothetical protein
MIQGEAGAPRLAEGMALLRDAARHHADADAANLLATLYAAGGATPPDWPMALDYLQLAAELGCASAQGQLLLLTSGGTSWRSRRSAVDMQAWLAPPSRLSLCDRPRVRACRDFIPPAMCDWLVELARGRLHAATTLDGAHGEARLSGNRTNSHFAFDLLSADCILALVRERISGLLKLPIVAMEPPQIFHYAPGQEYKPHVDYLHPDRAAGDKAHASDRIATFLVYLNDDFGGGETWFPRADLKVKAAKGGGLYFANVGVDGAPDPESLHAGLAPLNGEKWLFSQWIHDRPFAR